MFVQYLFSTVDSIIIVGIDEHQDDMIYSEPIVQYANPMQPGRPMLLYGPAGSFIKIKLYSVDGRLVKDMFSGKLEPGGISIQFHACDNKGRKLPSGTYFIILENEGSISTHKIILLN